MKKLLRSPKIVSIRGGHGWAKPDPPITEPYIHKRENSIFDSNIWFYDDTAPEYAFSYPEIHMHDHFGVLKDWFYKMPYIFACFAFVSSFYYFGCNSHVIILILD